MRWLPSNPKSIQSVVRTEVNTPICQCRRGVATFTQIVDLHHIPFAPAFITVTFPSSLAIKILPSAATGDDRIAAQRTC